MKRPDTEEGIGQSTTKENQSEPHFTGGRVIDRRNFLKLGLGAITTAAIGESVLNHFLNLSKAEAVGLFGELGVNAEWLRINHPNVQVIADTKDIAGNLLRKMAVVNNSLLGPEEFFQNSIFYLADREGSIQHAYRPVSKIPMQSVGAILAIPGTSTIIAAGEGHFRGADTSVIVSHDLGKNWGENIWPNGYALSGGTLDLLQVNGTSVFYGNNGNYEGGIGGYLGYLDTSARGGARIQALTDTIRATNLRSAGSPRIASVDQSGTFQIVSLASERLAWGVDISRIDPATATASTDNYYPNELGYVYGLTQYEGQALVCSDISQLIKGFGVDSQGRPTGINYAIDYSGWFDNVASISDRARIFSLWAKPDSGGNVHVWFFGMYTSDDNHGVIGHYLKGTNPGTDPGALFYKDLGPLSASTMSPLQNQIQYKEVNGQKGFEFPVSSPRGSFAGVEFYPINSDYSPNPNAQFSYPNNGLERPITYQLSLPALLNRFVGGW